MKIRDYLNGSLMGQRSVICRKSRIETLQRFLAEIRPVTTNHPLVRIGGNADGGYLVPDDLEGIDACFSPGVAQTAEFESQMAARGIRCFMADFSVDGTPVQHPLFHFEKRFLGPVNDEKFMTLGNWVDRCAPQSDNLILQMDIEGSEFGVFLEAETALLSRFRIMVVEFHSMQSLWEERGFELIRLTFLKLLKKFEIVHIHPNNNGGLLSQNGLVIPPLLEFTFLRKDRVATKVHTAAFPHPLDRQNVPSKKDVALPQCWYQKP